MRRGAHRRLRDEHMKTATYRHPGMVNRRSPSSAQTRLRPLRHSLLLGLIPAGSVGNSRWVRPDLTDATPSTISHLPHPGRLRLIRLHLTRHRQPRMATTVHRVPWTASTITTRWMGTATDTSDRAGDTHTTTTSRFAHSPATNTWTVQSQAICRRRSLRWRSPGRSSMTSREDPQGRCLASVLFSSPRCTLRLT